MLLLYKDAVYIKGRVDTERRQTNREREIQRSLCSLVHSPSGHRSLKVSHAGDGHIPRQSTAHVQEAAPLLMQQPVNMPEKTEDGRRTWAPAMHVRDPEVAPGSSFRPGPVLAVTAI